MIYSRSLIVLMVVSFVMAYCLALIPLNDFLRGWRPNFVVLLLVYWLLQAPQWLGLVSAWLLGFLLDGFSGVYLGQHALSFSIVAYVVLVLYQRLRMFSLLQQAILVFVLLGLDQMMNSWIDMVVHGGSGNSLLLGSAFIGALLWPLLSSYLNRFQIKMI